MMLFGSRATGYARADSDYDIGVLFAGIPPDVAAILSLHSDLQRTLATDRVDLAVLNTASTLLRFQVSQTGIPLVAREATAYPKFCVRSLQENNDARLFYEAERIYLHQRFDVPPGSAEGSGESTW